MFCTCRDGKDVTSETLNATLGPLRDIGNKNLPSKASDVFALSLNEFITLGDPNRIFTLGEKLAEGNFGSVYAATDNRDKKSVVVKQLSPDARVEDIEREVRGQAVASRHPAVCAIYGVFVEEGWLTWSSLSSRRVWLVMEYAKGVTLSQEIPSSTATSPRLPMNVIAKRAREMLECIQFLHSHRVIHRDLQDSNWILDEQSNLRLTDFGSSLLLPADNDVVKQDAIVGTLSYLAPEVYTGEYSCGVDIFAIGVLMIQMANGMSPYYFAEMRLGQLLGNKMSVAAAAEKVKAEAMALKVNNHPAWSPEFESLVYQMIALDPAKRITATDALKHPFVAKQ